MTLLEDKEGKLDAESSDNLRRVKAASRRMGHLMDDLINLARVSRAEMNRKNLDFSKVAGEVAEELRAGTPQSIAEVVIADGLSGHPDPRSIRVVLNESPPA